MKALSIRQPWAWLILHAGKDIENRTWRTGVRGEVAIHASSTMTRAEYMAAFSFVRSIDEQHRRAAFAFPLYEATLREHCGGVVGFVEIVDCVRQSPSPWFVGPYGFVLRNARPRSLYPMRGALGFFEI